MDVRIEATEKKDIKHEYQFSQRKIFFHAEHLLKALNREMVFPIVLELSLSGSCNNNCVYCCCSNYRDEKILNREQIDSVVKQASVFVRAMTVTGGGEPTLNPFFDYALERIKYSGMSVGVITNGVNLNTVNIESITKYASFCRISLDSVDKHVYNALRQPRNPDCLDEVLNGLNSLIVFKKRFRSKLIVGAQIVLRDQTHDDIRQTILTLRELGADFLQIRPEDFIVGHDSKPRYDYYDELFYFLESLKDYSTDTFNVILNHNKLTEYFEHGIGKQYIGCNGANFTASIGHDYNVYFCCSHIGNTKYLLGDLVSKSSLEEILCFPKRRELIDNCDHNDCQMQCRNHQLNKILESLKEVNRIELENDLKRVVLTSPPMHFEFL